MRWPRPGHSKTRARSDCSTAMTRFLLMAICGLSCSTGGIAMHAVATTWSLDATNRSMEKPPKSDLVGKLAAELEVLEAMEYSPALETLRAEKRQRIHNLQRAKTLE